MKNKALIVIGIVALCIAVALLFLTTVDRTSADTIKIGFIGPLTGDAAAYGEADRDGMMLAVEEINAAGGIDGKQIEAIYEDGKCTSQDGLSAAQKLITFDQVHYIVGGGCTNETLAAIPIASKSKVLMLSPSASAAQLSGSSPFFLRNYPNDNEVATAMADYVRRTYATVGIISEKTDYALGLKSAFENQAKINGLSIVADETYEPSTTDFRSILLKIKQKNPEVLFINPQSGANIARIAVQARELGMTVKLVAVNYTGSDVLAGDRAVEGLVAAVAPGLQESARGSHFIALYIEKYGAAPTYAFPAAAAYDDVYLIKQGVEAVGEHPESIGKYLRTLSSFDGALGTYHFNAAGDVEGIRPIFQKIQDGKVVPL